MSISTRIRPFNGRRQRPKTGSPLQGASGTGPGSIQWTAAANTTNASRTAHITVTPVGIASSVDHHSGSAVITATITLTPTSVAAPASASNGTITVTSTNQSLTWTAVSSNSWLTITRLLGNWKRLVPVQRRGKSERRGPDGDNYRDAFQRDGRVLTVTQAGGTLTISPPNTTANPTGDMGTISVSTDDSSLQWTATKTEAWITITAGATGTGTGSIQWTAAPNTGSNTRTTVITITPTEWPRAGIYHHPSAASDYFPFFEQHQLRRSWRRGRDSSHGIEPLADMVRGQQQPGRSDSHYQQWNGQRRDSIYG